MYLYKVVTGTLSLLKGIGVTAGYFFNPTRIVTEQYPENRAELKMYERFRGEIIMPHDETGEHNCTACTLCQKACPNGTISILPTKSISGTKVLGRFVYRFGQCTLCGLCVEICPFDAIRVGQRFEGATDDRMDLEYVLNRKEGRS